MQRLTYVDDIGMTGAQGGAGPGASGGTGGRAAGDGGASGAGGGVCVCMWKKEGGGMCSGRRTCVLCSCTVQTLANANYTHAHTRQLTRKEATAALAAADAANRAQQAEIAALQPQARTLRTLRRARFPVLALFMAGAPGLGFGVRTAYVAYAAGAWVHGSEALGACVGVCVVCCVLLSCVRR